MNYPKSLEWLGELVAFGVKTGTDHTRTIAGRLKDPQFAFPSVLVGGTNGKGSTAAFLESVLREAGYRTGLFTSPHLVDIRERIRIAGEPVPKNRFGAAASEVKKAYIDLEKEGVLGEPPTFFEALTLMGFLLFREEKVEIAVVEVGMGGARDCTNILEPCLSVLTNVSMDHENYLGDKLQDIVREKAGIFRKGTPALLGKTGVRTESLVIREASRIKPSLALLNDWKLERNGGLYAVTKGRTRFEFPEPPLPGRHQAHNAALAVLAVAELNKMGCAIDGEAVSRGIAACAWRCRMEKVMTGPDTWLDGAHNIDGVKTVRHFADSIKGKKVLLFAAMKDKPVQEMVKILKPSFDRLVFTEVPMARSARKEDYSKLIRPPASIFVREPAKALEKARKEAGEKGTVVIAGSLYLAGYLLSSMEGPEPALWGTGL